MSWNVWGHEWAESLLKKHIAGKMTRHAYLFTGAPGIGRRTLALAFTKALYCQNAPEPGEFCGSCPWTKASDGVSPGAEGPGGTLPGIGVREMRSS